MLKSICVILLSILMSSTAHVFLKKGMMSIAQQTISGQGFVSHVWFTVTNTWIIGGMALHVGALGVWLLALSRVDITFAYPFLALGYVLVSLMAWLWLGENINHMRVLGMIIIIAGIVVLSRSS